MKHCDADALRRAMEGARTDPSFAADLVRDTLARHGLMPGQPTGAAATLQPDLASHVPMAPVSKPGHSPAPRAAAAT